MVVLFSTPERACPWNKHFILPCDQNLRRFAGNQSSSRRARLVGQNPKFSVVVPRLTAIEVSHLFDQVRLKELCGWSSPRMCGGE